MPEIAGLPFRELHLDQTGHVTKHVAPFQPQITDVLVFAHGWNNDYNDAHDLHDSFFEKMVEVLLQHTAKRAVRPGLIGVFWPSILWPRDEPPIETTGVPSFGPTGRNWSEELKKAFPTAAQRHAIARMRELIDTRPTHPEVLTEFQQSLAVLKPASMPPETAEQRAIFEEDPAAVFDSLAGEERSPQAVNGYPAQYARIWRGAREAARIVCYWAMRERAQNIGESGLRPFLTTLPPALRLHLVGHGFGARMVYSAVRAGASNVKSLYLLQPALLPQDVQDAAINVDGPVLLVDRTAGASTELLPPGSDYRFDKGKTLHVNGGRVLTDASWPPGAHTDIIHQEIAWAGLLAAGIVVPATR